MSTAGGYDKHAVFVGSYEPREGERVEFRGKQLKENHVLTPTEAGGDRDNKFTFYETPDGGRLIYEQETVTTGPTERKPGLRASQMLLVRSDLYTPEEARQKGPIVQEVLRRFERDS